MSVIFVTGQIGSGKSLFTKCFADLGAKVIDADKIVSHLYETNANMVSEIEKVLGLSIHDESGQINKKLVANKIFSDDNLRRSIEEIIHPLVRAQMQAEVTDPMQVYVYEIPVVTSTTDLSLAKKIVVVEAPEDLRKSRLIARGMDIGDVEARIGSQSRNFFEIAGAVHVLNSGSIAELKSAAAEIYSRVLHD